MHIYTFFDTFFWKGAYIFGNKYVWGVMDNLKLGGHIIVENIIYILIYLSIVLGILIYFISLKVKEKEHQLKENENKFNKYLNFTTDSVIIFDELGRIIYANDSTIKKLGYSKNEITNLNISQIDPYLFTNIHMEKIFRQLDKIEFLYFDTKRLTRKGQSFPVEIRLCNYYYYNKKQRYVLCIARDISEQKKAYDEIYKLSFYDQLTRLPNRKQFNRVVDDFIRSNISVKCAVLMVDINNFKTYNEMYGHEFGDNLLIEFSKRLKENINSFSELSRISADEFIIFKRNVKNSREIYNLANKLIKSCNKPIFVQGQVVNVTISIGISMLPTDADSRPELLKKADFALYNAKQAGKNEFRFFDQELSKKIEERNKLINDMKEAIDNDKFELYYQPIIDLGSQKYVSLEALLRWNHYKFGYISPQEFIELAEETDLIIPLGNWVIEKVVSQIKKWELLGLDNFKVSINISSLQLKDSKFYNTIVRIFNKYNVLPERIIFEITETVFLSVEDSINKIINRIINLGISFSLDDFGTGYSSLNYLKKIPISHLKIDKSFIVDITKDSFNKSLMKAILHLAKNININVIAEGVETKEQLDFLKEYECDAVQGYLFEKPAPVKEITDKLYKSI